MAANIWDNSDADGDGNNVDNWSLGALAATDVLTFDGAVDDACTFTGAISCAGISVVVGYTGVINDGGQAFTVAGNVAITSGGAVTISGAWGITGDLTFGSALTHTGTFTMNGAAAQTITSGGQTLYNVTINRTTAGTMLFSGTTSLRTLTASATNTQAISWTGTTMTASGNLTLDGSGTLNCGNGITANGASSNVHFGSTLGAVTASSCVLTMNTATAGVIDDDYGATLYSFAFGNNAIATSSGSANTTLNATSNIIVLGSSASLTLSSTIIAFLLSGGDAWTFGIGSSLSITAGKFLTCRVTAGGAATLPALTATGAGAIQVLAFSDLSSIKLTGNQSLGTLGFYLGTYQPAAATSTINLNNFNITCGAFSVGNGVAAGGTFNCGAGLIQCSSLVVLANIAGFNFNLQTSQWTCTGNWAFESNWTVTGTAATQSVTITNTSSITSNGKQFPGSLIINAAGKTITMIDALSVASALTLTAGTLNTATFAVTVGGNTAINGTSTLTASGSTCSFAGDYTTAAGSTVTINATTNYTFTKNGAIVTTNGKALPQVTFNSNFSINDTCTITRLIMGVDGFTGTFEAGQTFTLSNLAAANWSGAAGLLNAFRSSIPGTQFTLAIPNIVTLQYVNPQDADLAGGFQITVNDGTSVNSGNNDVNWIWPVVVPITGGGGEGGASRCYIGGPAIGI